MAYDKIVDSSVLDAGLTKVADAIRTRWAKDFTASWTPSQEGTGTPSLTNIRPIVAKEYIYYGDKAVKLTFSEPIYGGTISADGTGTKTWVIQTFDGTEKWNKSSSATYGYWVYPTIVTNGSNANSKNEVICDRYESDTYNNYLTKTAVISHDNSICIATSAFTTLAAWKAYLAEQYAAGTPLQVAYVAGTKESFTTQVENCPISFPTQFVESIGTIGVTTKTITTGGASDELMSFIKGVLDRTTTATQFPSELSNITKIGAYAFSYCTKLALTSLPSTVTYIENSAFANCTDLALTSLPDGITSIQLYTFRYCPKLALTTVPDGVQLIGSYAFQACTGLTSFTLPSGIKTISNNAFYGCTGLTTVTFKGTPTSLSSSAFKNCTNLTTINVPWAEGAVDNAPWSATNATINYNYTGE